MGYESLSLYPITSGNIDAGWYSTTITTDCTAASTIYLDGGGWSSGQSYVVATIAPPEANDDGEESALDWLDRRVEEMCVEL